MEVVSRICDYCAVVKEEVHKELQPRNFLRRSVRHIPNAETIIHAPIRALGCLRRAEHQEPMNHLTSYTNL